MAAELSTLDLVAHLHRQRAFSERTFGPGARTAGVLDHIRKELAEIERDPGDVTEWIDVVLLALDGAWRAGHEPEAIAAALAAKQAKNELRTWPDWRTADPNRAIEHERAEAPKLTNCRTCARDYADSVGRPSCTAMDDGNEGVIEWIADDANVNEDGTATETATGCPGWVAR
jgi:hypothetical protein